eukprot:COSAG04_NODE_635_length_11712_cov_7.556187_10_plen_365_part_00
MLGNGGNRWLPLMTWLMVQPSLMIDGGENSPTIVASPKGQAYHGTRSPLLPPTEGMLQLVDRTAERWHHVARRNSSNGQPTMLGDLIDPLYNVAHAEAHANPWQKFLRVTTRDGLDPIFPDLQNMTRAHSDADRLLEWLADPGNPRSLTFFFENPDESLGLFGHVMSQELRDFAESQDKAATVHYYVSPPGGAGLSNHTDVTDIVVQQLAGEKAWLLCDTRRAAQKSSGDSTISFLSDAQQATFRNKLSKCSQYDPEEMALVQDDCTSLVLRPGELLFLPRGTLHSARAIGDETSVHVTVGIKRVSAEDRSRRRLQTCSVSDVGNAQTRSGCGGSDEVLPCGWHVVRVSGRIVRHADLLRRLLR